MRSIVTPIFNGQVTEIGHDIGAFIRPPFKYCYELFIRLLLRIVGVMGNGVL